MESQTQNPEFRINPENFHPCISILKSLKQVSGNRFIPVFLAYPKYSGTFNSLHAR